MIQLREAIPALPALMGLPPPSSPSARCSNRLNVLMPQSDSSAARLARNSAEEETTPVDDAWLQDGAGGRQTMGTSKSANCLDSDWCVIPPSFLCLPLCLPFFSLVVIFALYNYEPFLLLPFHPPALSVIPTPSLPHATPPPWSSLRALLLPLFTGRWLPRMLSASLAPSSLPDGSSGPASLFKKKGNPVSASFPPKGYFAMEISCGQEGLPVRAFLSHWICLLWEPGVPKHSSAVARAELS